MAETPTVSTPVRVLLCGDFLNAIQPLARQCSRALEELGAEVMRVDTEVRRRKLPETAKRWSKSLAKLLGRKHQLARYYDQGERARRNERVRQAFRANQPDVVLVIRGNDVDAGLLREMRDAGAVTAGWWIKDVRRAGKMLVERPNYDLYYCIHLDHCREGIRHLPAYAVDTGLFPCPTERHYLYDIGFVGIWQPKRQAYLEPLADLRLGIVGPGWRTRNLRANRSLMRHVVATSLHGEALTRFYQSARIVLNINQWEASEASGTTLRVADVPACGAFLLTEYSRGLEDIFELEREIVTFSSREELERKARYFLKRDAEREAIALAGHQRALGLPRHADRMRVIVADAARLLARSERKP